MLGIVGISRGDAREEVLIIFARKQVAVLQRLLAELGQKSIALGIGLDVELGRVDRLRAAARDRDIITLNFAAGRKIHRASPSCLGPVENRLFLTCSTRSHAGILAFFRARWGFLTGVPLWKAGTNEPVTGI